MNNNVNSEIHIAVNRVFDELGLQTPVLLGKGDEGRVYEYGADALKIYPRKPDLEYLRNLQSFQTDCLKGKFAFDTPEIFEIGQVDEIVYTIEKRLHGIQMDKVIVGMSTTDRQKVYQSYYDAIRQVHQISFFELPYGEIIKMAGSTTAESWDEFLIAKLDKKVKSTRERISPLIANYDVKVESMKRLIGQQLQSNEKRLVHRDYFLNNVLVGGDLQISAILDFSGHVVAGDPRMDIASVLRWNEIDPRVRLEDYSFLDTQAEQDYGSTIHKIADLYLLYSGFYFADMDDPSFSVEHLNDDQLWQGVNK